MNKKDNKLILIGGFHEVIELCEMQNIEIIGIIDNFKKSAYLGYPVLGTDNDVIELFNSYGNIPILITPDQPKIRNRIAEVYQRAGYIFVNLISSHSLISKSAELGTGVLIHSKVNISANVIIGDFVRVNAMANIMHDSVIGQYTTIAPNAVVLGNVKIGCLTYIGSNATILPGITIGNEVIIGAGAVVTNDVSDGKTMVGNPARELTRKELI
jgi:sugar O-acyltransferase (sialic acid O-acetyltransferase NeuD family)